MRGKTIFLLLFFIQIVFAQSSDFQIISIDSAVKIAIQNNPAIVNATLEIKKAELKKQKNLKFEPLEFTYRYGQIYSPLHNKYLEINQEFGSVLKQIKCYKESNEFIQLEKTKLKILEKELTIKVKSACFFWLLLYNKLNVIDDQKNKLSNLLKTIDLKYEANENDSFKKQFIESQIALINVQFETIQDELIIAQNMIKNLLYTNNEIIPEMLELDLYMINKTNGNYSKDIYLNKYELEIKIQTHNYNRKKRELLPNLSFGYFYHDIGDFKELSGWQVKLGIPLLYIGHRAEIKQEELNKQIAENTRNKIKFEIEKEIENLKFELNKYFRLVRYYREYGLQQAESMIEEAELKLEKKEIDYLDYIKELNAGFKIMIKFFETINNYNQTAIQLELYAN